MVSGDEDVARAHPVGRGSVLASAGIDHPLEAPEEANAPVEPVAPVGEIVRTARQQRHRPLVQDDLQIGALGGQPRDQPGVVVMVMGQQGVADIGEVDSDGPERGQQRLRVGG